jgi:hypothetical protein
MPRGLAAQRGPRYCHGLGAFYFRKFEQPSRGTKSLSVVYQPTRRARASGSISRQAPHSHTTRMSEVAEAIVEPLETENGRRTKD